MTQRIAKTLERTCLASLAESAASSFSLRIVSLGFHKTESHRNLKNWLVSSVTVMFLVDYVFVYIFFAMAGRRSLLVVETCEITCATLHLGTTMVQGASVQHCFPWALIMLHNPD